ncbi:MAG TPA: three-Cys-motif partner protein TcmP [Solirubrobacterales bacterium]|nr:three-Cys-motif partner protein TcmP [Solirubrobacterales bacterium]
MSEQLNIFRSFGEAGAGGWGKTPTPPPTDLSAPQLPLITNGGLIPEEDSGALARAITSHSLTKQDRIIRYADTVSVAMSRRWKIWWLDLFAGPGAVYHRHLSDFRPGIPVEVADRLQRPFDGYVFSDLSSECVSSLTQRLAARPNLTIAQGDANDPLHIEALIARIPREALVLAYLDPQGLDLHLETIRLLAWRFRHLDLLINLPVRAIDRSISAKAIEPVKRVLEHPNPQLLLAGRRTDDNIRAWFQRKLSEMGYPEGLSVGETIRSENGVAQYDLLLASRSPTAIKLYRRANQSDSGGQRTFEFAC